MKAVNWTLGWLKQPGREHLERVVSVISNQTLEQFIYGVKENESTTGFYDSEYFTMISKAKLLLIDLYNLQIIYLCK